MNRFNHAIVHPAVDWFWAGAERVQRLFTRPLPAPPPATSTHQHSPKARDVSRSPKRKKSTDALELASRIKSKRRKSSGEDILDLLQQAIARDAARQILEERLREARPLIDERQNAIEELTCRAKVLEGLKDGFPELEDALTNHANDVKRWREELKSYADNQELMEERLDQSKTGLRETLHKVYQLTDSFISSLDESGNLPNGISVPTEFAGVLRTAAHCSRPLSISCEQVKKLRADVIEDGKAFKAAKFLDLLGRRRTRRREALLRLKRAEKTYATQIERQDKRVEKMLPIARAFLVEAGLMKVPVSPANVSSTDHIGPRSPAPDLVLPESDKTKKFKRARNGVAKGRKKLDDYERNYSAQLALHLFANPQSTRKRIDDLLAEKMRQRPEDSKANTEKKLGEWQARYDGILERVKKSKEEDRSLLLTAYWAASEFDSPPSQTTEVRIATEPKKMDMKRREIKRWMLETDGSSPKGENQSVSSSAFSPPAFRALPPPHPKEAMIGPYSPTLSQRSLQRRIRRLHP